MNDTDKDLYLCHFMYNMRHNNEQEDLFYLGEDDQVLLWIMDQSF